MATQRELQRQLGELTIRDEHRLRRKLSHRLNATQLAVIEADVSRAAARIALRRADPPRIGYPGDLPITARRQDLLDAIAGNQVVVVAGETGSGKTTQLPKLCLELGRGVRGLIGHTQPRRIAARAVAHRLGEELGGEVGGVVGFAVRFTDEVGAASLVKLMTDGILLAEISRDRMLRSYDTIIIDEAHERSLNIDFLLGYLRTLLPRRPDLKLIITSATIDPQRFAAYFKDPTTSLDAPIIEVSGRGYPVQVRYRPIVDPDDPAADPDRDQLTAVCDAVAELRREPIGDVLVFLSGEREIRDTADALTAMNLTDTEIVPLYARQSGAEQHRVFAPHRGRRIVLATNVAETSLTVPGVKYVVDAGTARISRYSNRTKVQLLPIEAISQASAAQRAGRCGRTSPGICVRLYSEADFDSRPAFTDPEITRTNLASVILQMACLDLGPVADFGFVDPPDKRQIADGVRLLTELGAFDTRGALTPIGRQLARLPLDPRLARMVLEARDRGCVADVLVLVAALSITDPRERPAEHQQAADAAHARFSDPTSDFATLLNLWRHIREQQRALSSSQFRRMCRSEFLNYLRVREWQDLFIQLRQICKGMAITVGEPASGDADLAQIHRSLLAGLLSHIGGKDVAKRDYLGARGARFSIFPGSGLAKKQPEFVMAAELVETSRLFARVVARIDSEWVEELAGDLAKRTYSEPHWERRRGSAVATERVTVYGVPVVTARKVDYHRVDPVLARELFIRHALVEGDFQTRHHFWQHNRDLVTQLSELADRARRSDVFADDDAIYAFYDERIPAEVVSARHFDTWWKRTRRQTPELLDLTADVLRGTDIDADAFPTTWSAGDFKLDLSYRFTPGAADDGVTMAIPLPLLTDPAVAGLDWQVPGLRADLVTALLRGLDKPLRRLVAPIPDTAAELVSALPVHFSGSTTTLTEALSASLARRGVEIAREDWNLDKLPDHLKPTYQVVSGDGAVLATGKDLSALQARFAPDVASAVADAGGDLTRSHVRAWDFGDLEKTVQVNVGGHLVVGYPALVAEGDLVAVRVLDSEIAQRVAMRAGARRLLMLVLSGRSGQARPAKRLLDGLSAPQRLALSQAPHASLSALLDDCVEAAVDSLIRKHGGPVWDLAAFSRLRDAVSPELAAATRGVLDTTVAVLADARATELAITQANASIAHVVEQVRGDYKDLIYPGFVTATGAERLPALRRYLAALAIRLADAPAQRDRDEVRQQQIRVVEQDLAELRRRLSDRGPSDPAVVEPIRWMIEELRVSLFAQRLGTSAPVSVARIQAAMDRLDPP